jgi:hypothetical protein
MQCSVPEERGGTPAKKIPTIYAFRVLNAGKWTKKKCWMQRQYSPVPGVSVDV